MTHQTAYPEGQWRRPIAWVLERTPSVFVAPLKARMANGSAPEPIATVFRRGDDYFAIVHSGAEGSDLTLPLSMGRPFGRRTSQDTARLYEAAHVEARLEASMRALERLIGKEHARFRTQTAIERVLGPAP